MKPHATIVRVQHPLPPALLALAAEAVAEGHDFMQRFVQEWASGENRYEGPGEAMFALAEGERLVATGGVIADPYLKQPGVGRLRRVYVAADRRRRGYARLIVNAVIAHAAGRFDTIRLRAPNADAGRFYASLGFTAVPVETGATHVLALR